MWPPRSSRLLPLHLGVLSVVLYRKWFWVRN